MIKRIDKGIDNKNYLLAFDKNKFFLKIYPERNIKEIQFEIEILNKLSELKNCFPEVCSPVIYIDNSPGLIFTYLEGKNLISDDINVKILGKIAILLAKMHNLLINFKTKYPKFRIPILDYDFKKYFPFNEKMKNGQIALKALNELKEESRIYKHLNLRKSVIHEDLILDNIIIDKFEKVKFVDFDDSHQAEIISDISTGVKELIIAHKGLNKNLIKNFLSAYQSTLRLNPDELSIIPFLIKRRAVFMLIYLLYKNTKAGAIDYSERINAEQRALNLICKNYREIKEIIKKS